MRDFVRRLRPHDALALGLMLLALTHIFVVNGLVLHRLFGTQFQDLVLSDAQRIVGRQPRLWNDSWFVMATAGAYAESNPDIPVYSGVFFSALKLKFQYPMSSLLFLRWLNRDTKWLLDPISWLAILVMAVFIFLILRLGLRAVPEGSNGGNLGISTCLLALAVVTLTLTYYPIVRGNTLGQIQVWINTLFAVLIWCWLTERRLTAGVVAGLCCLIKPQYALVLIWGVLRAQRRFVCGMVITVLVGLAFSLRLYGLVNNLEYLRVLSYISQHGEAFYPNQSINGLLNRFLFNGNNTQFLMHDFPPYHPVVYFGTVVSSLVFILLGLFLPMRSGARGSTIDLCVIALTWTLASPIAWEHHYGILLPIFAVLLPALLARPVFGRATIPLLIVLYLVSASSFEITKILSDTHWNVLQSYLFFSGVMILGTLYGLLRPPHLSVS